VAWSRRPCPGAGDRRRHRRPHLPGHPRHRRETERRRAPRRFALGCGGAARRGARGNALASGARPGRGGARRAGRGIRARLRRGSPPSARGRARTVVAVRRLVQHRPLVAGSLLADHLPLRELPRGTVTFLFTDIEGSTRLLRELGEGYAQALAEHRRLLRDAFTRWSGVEIDTQGDAFFVAFSTAQDAVLAAEAGQAVLADA